MVVHHLTDGGTTGTQQTSDHRKRPERTGTKGSIGRLYLGTVLSDAGGRAEGDEAPRRGAAGRRGRGRGKGAGAGAGRHSGRGARRCGAWRKRGRGRCACVCVCAWLSVLRSGRGRAPRARAREARPSWNVTAAERARQSPPPPPLTDSPRAPGPLPPPRPRRTGPPPPRTRVHAQDWPSEGAHRRGTLPPTTTTCSHGALPQRARVHGVPFRMPPRHAEAAAAATRAGGLPEARPLRRRPRHRPAWLCSCDCGRIGGRTGLGRRRPVHAPRPTGEGEVCVRTGALADRVRPRTGASGARPRPPCSHPRGEARAAELARVAALGRVGRAARGLRTDP